MKIINWLIDWCLTSTLRYHMYLFGSFSKKFTVIHVLVPPVLNDLTNICLSSATIWSSIFHEQNFLFFPPQSWWLVHKMSDTLTIQCCHKINFPMTKTICNWNFDKSLRLYSSKNIYQIMNFTEQKRGKLDINLILFFGTKISKKKKKNHKQFHHTVW